MMYQAFTRRRLPSILLAFGTFAALAAVTWAWRGAAARRWHGRSDWPMIEISQERVDLGRLRPLEEVTRVVTIANRGGRPLELGKPTTTCGCQKPRLARTVLAPGESTELVLEQQAQATVGPFQHLIWVPSNDPATPAATLVVFGQVSRGVAIRPDPLDFGAVRSGEEAMRVIEVASKDGQPFRITRARGAGAFTVRTALDRPGTLHRVEVSFKAPATIGRVRNTVELTTDRPDTSILSINVGGRVAGNIESAVSALTLGTVQPHQEVVKSLVLTGQAPFRVASVAGPAAWKVAHRLPQGEGAGTMRIVEVTLRVPDDPGLLEGNLEVETILEGGRPEHLTLPVTGFIGRREPTIDVADEEIGR